MVCGAQGLGATTYLHTLTKQQRTPAEAYIHTPAAVPAYPIPLGGGVEEPEEPHVRPFAALKLFGSDLRQLLGPSSGSLLVCYIMLGLFLVLSRAVVHQRGCFLMVPTPRLVEEVCWHVGIGMPYAGRRIPTYPPQRHRDRQESIPT